METPRAASLPLIQAALVSSRSPSRISVPMVRISALLKWFVRASGAVPIFSFCIPLFYNPHHDRRRPPRSCQNLCPRTPLSQTLRPHLARGRHRGTPCRNPRHRPEESLPRRPPARRGPGGGQGGAFAGGRGGWPGRRRVRARTAYTPAWTRSSAVREERSRGKGRRDPRRGASPHHGRTGFVADKIEPEREGPGVEDLRGLARKARSRSAHAALQGSLSHNEECDRPAHPKSLETLRWLEGSGEGGVV